jgi:D-alanine-D-alanine ligase
VSHSGHEHKRLRVGLVFGGRSGEHDVSVVSARSVSAALDPGRFEVVPFAIDRTGRWADGPTSMRVLETSGDRTDQVVDFTGTHALAQDLVSGSIDVAFPILHGPYGEDGTVQGLFEILDIPYVGCDHYASAICMDKITTKRLLVQAGLPTPPWVEVTSTTWESDGARATAACLDLGLPLFVKPARLGSSVGISRVADPSDLAGAVEIAFKHDHRVIVEQGVDAREIEIAVLGNAHPRASIPGEVIPGHEFYDYEDKYLDDSCQLLAPAPIDHATSTSAAQLAVTAYGTLGCQGMARVDLFLGRGTGELSINEINTIPGFTSISMYPKLWQLSGLGYPDLLGTLVRLAIERHQTNRFPR